MNDSTPDEKSVAKTFSERFKKLRETEGLEQNQLAKQLGMNFSTISSYESGRRMPNIIYLRKIADFFGVTADYLVGIEPSLGVVTVAKWSDKMEAYSDANGEYHAGFRCSNCKMIANKALYCGNCGARMLRWR